MPISIQFVTFFVLSRIVRTFLIPLKLFVIVSVGMSATNRNWVNKSHPTKKKGVHKRKLNVNRKQLWKKNESHKRMSEKTETPKNQQETIANCVFGRCRNEQQINWKFRALLPTIIYRRANKMQFCTCDSFLYWTIRSSIGICFFPFLYLNKFGDCALYVWVSFVSIDIVVKHILHDSIHLYRVSCATIAVVFNLSQTVRRPCCSQFSL